MANPDRLMAAGLAPEIAAMLGQLTAVGLTATGTTATDAFPLITQNAKFSTVASGTGCLLPSSQAQPPFAIYNGGANTLKVYPISTQTINGGAAGAAFSIVAGEAALFTALDSIGWVAVAATNGAALTVPSIVGSATPFTISGLPAAVGGNVVIYGADGLTAGGGSLTLAGGNAASGSDANGGALNLVGGTKDGSGANGEVGINSDANLVFATYYFTGAAAATDQVFFIANRALKVKSIKQIHSVAAGGTSTLTVIKDTGTDAPGAGTTLMQGSFNLNATANTIQSATLAASAATIALASGNRLSVKFANAIQASDGVVVTVGMMPA